MVKGLIHSVERMCAFINSQRASAEDFKSKLFEHIDYNTDTPSDTINELGNSDMIFIVGPNTYNGHQKLFSELSPELKECLELVRNGHVTCTPFNYGGVLRAVRSCSSGIPRITVDTSVDVFEAIFKYCYSSRLTISVHLVPAVYFLSKKLKITPLQTACANFLTQNLTFTSIGALCRMVQFSRLSEQLANSISFCNLDECQAADLRLAESLHRYLLDHSDIVACSQTGQLSARLIVNLNGELNQLDNVFGFIDPKSEQLAFRVLRWAYERLLAGERLTRTGTNDNVHSDDEESDGSSGLASSGVPLGSKRKRAGSQFQFLAHVNALYGTHPKSSGTNGLTSDEEEEEAQNEVEGRIATTPLLNDFYNLSTQDIRITVDINDIYLDEELTSLTKHPLSQGTTEPTDIPPEKLLSLYVETGGPESETCLLAPTSLGVSTTSIWLGKLAGHLVSLSIKRCLPTTSSVFSSLSQGLNYFRMNSQSRQSSGSSLSDRQSSIASLTEVNASAKFNEAKIDETRLNNLADQRDTTHSSNDDCIGPPDCDEICLTMTPSSASILSRALVSDSLPKSCDLIDVFKEHVPFGSCFRTDLLENPAIPGHPLRMLKARCGFGVGLLGYTGISSKHSSNISFNDYWNAGILLIIGGYTRKGCLDSVELYSVEQSEHTLRDENSLNDLAERDRRYFLSLPEVGPRLTSFRGRLGVATSFTNLDQTFPDVIYACGGSTGSKDLNSVEKITSASLKRLLENHSKLHKTSSEQLGQNHQQQNVSRRFSGLHTKSDCQAYIGRNTGAGSGHTGSQFANWQTLAPLNQARSSPTAFDLSKLTNSGPLISNPRGSILLAGGLSGAKFLSSVEAYVADRDQWIYLPNMLEARREAASGVLTSRNLAVVVGGMSSNCGPNDSNVIVEGLDLRCSRWFQLPSPMINSVRQLRGSNLTLCPLTQEHLLLIGGYNGRDTLDSTWLFDPVAWSWSPGPHLIIPRANCSSITYADGDCSFIFGGYNPSTSMGGFLDTIEMIS